jgi:uncharacterized cupin superfamily protein
MSMYHWETDHEEFLVLSGEAMLIIEGKERSLRPWDFVHCPPETGRVIVGGLRVVLGVGSRERHTMIGADAGILAHPRKKRPKVLRTQRLAGLGRVT